jgi:predicted lipid-binding transport protein (Tim44 family)
MGDTIVKLETRAQATNRTTVEVLEEALADARAGKIQEVALALVYRDLSTGWRRSGSDNIATLIGAASVLVHSLHLWADESKR